MLIYLAFHKIKEESLLTHDHEAHMPRPPEAYRRSTLFDALHKELVVSEPSSQKKESLKDRLNLRGSIKRSIVGLFRTNSQQGLNYIKNTSYIIAIFNVSFTHYNNIIQIF